MANSRFGSHIKLWFFIVPILALFLLPILDDPPLFQVSDAESGSVSALLGDSRSQDAVDRANADFQSWFIDTGAVRLSLEETQTGDRIDERVADPFANRWVHNFWFLIYRMIYRATVAKYWIFGTFFMCLASFMDSWAKRKIGAAVGGVVRPLHFHVAAHGILLVAGVVFAVLIVPAPVLAPFWVAISAILVFLLWRAAASYQ